eukprot:m.55098 g.55098  ORF g.55098 m.55098 type:complete len:418 (+) comp11113_c0_seq2:115-1368(+)
MSNDIGFANLQNQIHRAAVERGFEFTLMVAGRSGLGKSTFVNSLFSSKIYSDIPYGVDASPPTDDISKTTVTLIENNVQLRLTLVDTPGFGDAIDNTGCWDNVIQFINGQFELYDADESKVQRDVVKDIRVHCCLYFIPPSTHGLRPLDIEILKHLQHVVNVIPVIAKADTLTDDECSFLKQKIRTTLENEGIRVFQFPKEEEHNDTINDSVNDSVNTSVVKNYSELWPFALCASNKTINIDGKKTRGRTYPWGDLSIEDPLHSDFIALRDLLVRTHMQYLIDITNDIHFEAFRRSRLNAVGGEEGKDENVMDTLAKKRQTLLSRLEEQETEKLKGLREKYQTKVDRVAGQMENLTQKHDAFKTEMSKQNKLLDEQREQLEREKKEYEEAKQAEAEEREKEKEKEKKHKKRFFGAKK